MYGRWILSEDASGSGTSRYIFATISKHLNKVKKRRPPNGPREGKYIIINLAKKKIPKQKRKHNHWVSNEILTEVYKRWLNLQCNRLNKILNLKCHSSANDEERCRKTNKWTMPTHRSYFDQKSRKRSFFTRQGKNLTSKFKPTTDTVKKGD